MKKFLILISMLVFLLSFFGCEKEPEEIVLPPKRVSTDEIMVVRATDTAYSFEDAFSYADTVAHVRIKNWLREDTEEQYTYYEAEIVELFKGDEKEEITVRQTGSSVCTLNGFPLFTYGNEMLMFLKEQDGAYTVYGYATKLFDAVRAEDGETYYISRDGGFTVGVPGSAIYEYEEEAFDVKTNYSERASEFNDLLREMDELIGGRSCEFVFSRTDFLKLIKEIE